MFELKKIITAFVTIPGIFILFLAVTGIYGFKKKIQILKLNLLCGLILYCMSIFYFANNIIGLLEKESIYNGRPAVDVIILLGGGIAEGVPDISGKAVPSGDMTVRIVDAVRLHKKYKLPVLVSGGSVSGKVKEAVVVKRFLIDLGVKPNDIYLEDSSRDTVENALFTKKIFQKKGYKKGLLLTSAYHMRRSEYLFKKAGLDVYPHSAGILSEKKASYNIYDFLPGTGELGKTALTMREAMGLMFYYVKYEIF